MREIHNALLELGRKNVRYKFRWVPSHDGIPENEAGDRLAARGAARISERTGPLLVQPTVCQFWPKHAENRFLYRASLKLCGDAI